MKYILLAFILSGCYGLQKAKIQHGKAVSTFPEIGAEYCAITFPAKDSIIKGDSVLSFDTVYVGGETVFDTVVTKGDTVRIVKTVTQPAKVVTKTVAIHDTIIRVDRAAVELCAIERRNAIANETAERTRADKWEQRAKTRFWINLGLIFLIVGYVGANVYKSVTLKK